MRRLLAIAVLVLGSVGPVEAASTGSTITISCPKENYRITVPAAWKQKPCKGGAGALAARDAAAVGIAVSPNTAVSYSEFAVAILRNAGASPKKIVSGSRTIGGVRFQTLYADVRVKSNAARMSFAVTKHKGTDYAIITVIQTSGNPLRAVQAQQADTATESFRFLH